MRTLLRGLGALALGLMLAVPAAADVRRAPVKVRYVGEPVRSPLGKTTIHTLEIRANRPEVTIRSLGVDGAGWAPKLNEASGSIQITKDAPLSLRLEVTPNDVSQPLVLRYEVDGEAFEKAVDLSPKAIELARRARPVREVTETGRIAPRSSIRHVSAGVKPAPARAAWMEPTGGADDAVNKGGTRGLGGVRTIRVHGRFVYERSDGTTIGADGVAVRVYDEDDITVDPLLVTGITDSNGDYDVSFEWNGGCFGCENDPDIYVEWETANSEVDVEDATVLETNYRWESGTTTNFSGTDLNKGQTEPADESEHPALHICTDITRNWRWYLNNEGYDLPEVHAQWPENGTGAWYDDGPSPPEIHICPDRRWGEDTHAHEYGHHFIATEATVTTPDYCNGFCDTPSCGHCIWCQENANDAWAEGWPNWIAHVQTTSYLGSYGIASANTRNQENVVQCGTDGLFHPANLTEGFIGAFLQDAWDSVNEQDTGATSTWRDQLFLGTNEIFDVVDFDEPITPMSFITDLKNRNPSLKNQIWETAKNANFEMDVLVPPTVTNLVSTSHTINVDSPDPTITFTWTRADDDWSGPAGYSVLTGTSATLPNQTQDINDVTTYTTGVLAPGTYWFTIRTVDRSGKWDGNYASSGPYIVREPEDANLQPFLAAGWAHELVPRASDDATGTNVPAPVTLPGNELGTYFNLRGKNTGESTTSTGYRSYIYVDDLLRRVVIHQPLAAGLQFNLLNSGPAIVNGGRRTLSAVLDALDEIAETDENDNVYGRQWIWEPLVVGSTDEVVRQAPPNRTGGWDWITEGGSFYNVDGLRFKSGGSSWWHALAVHNPNTDEDYDCRLHFATETADSGFGANIGYSTRNAGCVDAVIVNRNTVGDTDWDVGVINVDGAAAYTARHVVSLTFDFEDSVDVTIPQDRMLLLREVWIPAGGPVSFTARIKNGTGPVHLAWLDEDFTTGDLLDNEGHATSVGPGDLARIDVNVASAGYHAFVLYRDPKDGTGEVVVTVEVESTPADLLAFAPAGWHGPLVPRPANDGTPFNVPAPDTLYGNATGTWLNYSVRNDGAIDATNVFTQFVLDGADAWSGVFPLIADNTYDAVNGGTARFIRGGRHTLAVEVDPLDLIDEMHDHNNTWAEQWVWSPMQMALNTAYTRSIPPDRTGGWGQVESGDLWFNCDGLRTPVFAPSGEDGWWAAVAAMPGDSSNVDLRLHEKAPGAQEGFALNLGVSTWGVGQSDFNLVNFRNTAPRGFDVGVTLGEGTESYLAQAVRSVHRTIGATHGPFIMPPNQILQLHEFDLDPGSYVFSLVNVSGTVDWGVTLHEPVTYHTKSQNIGSSYLDSGAGGNETFVVSPFVGGHYCVAVWKVGAADLPLSGSYTLRVSPAIVDAPQERPVAVTAFASAYPNPSRGRSTMAFGLAGPLETRLEIYDLRGARVRTLANGVLPAGRHAIEWRGDDDQGRPVAPGVYFVRFRAGGVDERRKLLRLE